MKFWVALGSSVAALMLSSGAIADPSPPRLAANAGDEIISAGQTADIVVQVAAVTREIAEFASTAVVAPPAAGSVETAPSSPADAAVKRGAAEPDKEVVAPAKSAAVKHSAKDKIADQADRHTGAAARRERLAAAEAKSPAVRPVGRSETGTAAWYGGRYVGRRTSSGERLDTIHATAAHRTLPLNCLARVTNLRNGRSVVVRVTDRGPLDDELLIDMSPRAADELRMKQAGLVPVRVEQVVEVPPDAK